MTWQLFGEKIRVRYEFLDVYVEKLNASGEWVVERTFNCMSDDYAYTNAAEYAKKLRAICDNNGSNGNQRTPEHE